MIEEFKRHYQEIAAQKRAEFEAALQRGDVEDPFTIASVVITWQAIALSAAVSAGVAVASYALSRAFAPKPQKQTLGKLSGSLQLQNSEQGIFIPEIYGAGPTASLVAGASPTWQNLTNTTSGANGSITKTSGANNTYNAGASHNASPVSGDDAFIQVIPGTGPASAGFTTTASPTNDSHFLFGVQWHSEGTLQVKISGGNYDVGHWNSGDIFRVEIRSGRFRLYKNSAEIADFPIAVPVPTYPLYFGVAMYATNSGVSNAKIKINAIGDTPNAGRGGVKIPAIIVWSSGIRKNVSVTQQPTGGGKGMGGHSQTVENITYDIDLGLEFCRGPVDLLREYGNADVLIDQMTTSPLPSGVYDPTTGADPTYDPSLPPAPATNYTLPFHRFDGDIPLDGNGVGSGSIQGGASNFTVYPGNATQQPDPTIEADINAKYGAGSTPAYRNHSLVVHRQFSLSRWGGIVPNVTAIWQHQTLKTLSAIFASLCERVNVLAANSDYDFSGLSALASRGMLITGRLFAPSEIIGSPDIQLVHNYFVTEVNGQIIGYAEGAEPSLTISDTEVGWLDGETEVPDIIPEVESILASEISFARQVDVRFIDPDKDWDPNTQSAKRQITDGQSTELLEVQLTLLADEARAVAQRKLYRDYVGGSAHKFTLPWTYLYLYPGYKIIINRTEGFTHTLRLTSIAGGIGVLECEGVALEPTVFNQPAVGEFGPGYLPSQPIPAMTIVSFLDTPLLRDGDETNNNGVGYYIVGVPRTGISQSWLGFVLYQSRNGVWNRVADSSLPGTVGVIVSATGLSSDPTVFDRSGVITVDLYGTTATLSSVTETDVQANQETNLGLFGDLLSNFASATKLAGYPNRWELRTLLHGRRGTEAHIADTLTGKRFVLINAAVKFVPTELSDLNQTFSYKAVTSGQSLADAATLTYAWSGNTDKPLSISNPRGTRDSAGSLLIEFEGRTRIGGGLRSYQAGAISEEAEEYRVQILNSGSTTLPNGKTRILPVIVGMAQAAVLINDTATVPGKFANGYIDINNMSVNGVNLSVTGHAIQAVLQAGNFIEATLLASGGGAAVLRFVDTDFATNRYSIFVVGSGGMYVQINNGSNIYVGSYTANTSVRVRITLSGAEVRFYVNYSSGSGTPPVYVSSVAPAFPLIPAASVATGASGAASVSQMILTTWPFPKTIYSAAQQTEDFGSVPPAVLVDIWEESKLLGPGVKTRVSLPAPYPSTAPDLIAGYIPDSLSAGALGTWAVSAGAANSFTQGTAANKPLVVASTLNGLPVVRFDPSGSNDFMTLATKLTTVRSVYVVVKYDQSTSTNCSRFMSVLADDTVYHWYGNEGSRLFDASTTSANVINGTAYHNGYPISPTYISKSGNYALYSFVTTGNTTIGNIANDRVTHFFGGDVAEMWFYSSAHATTDRQNIENYLKNKYSLTLPKLIVCDGNSLTGDRPGAGQGYVAAGDAWSSQMIPVLNATSFGVYDTYNVAVTGRNTVNANTDAVTAVDPLFNAVRSRNILVFWEGTNAMGSGSFSSGTDAYNQLVTYFANRKAAHPWKVVAVTCLKRQDAGLTGPQQTQFEIDRLVYNQAIRDNWVANGWDAIVDLDTADYYNNGTGALGSDGTPDLNDPTNTLFYNADKIHLVALGQTVVMKAVEAKIAAL